MSVTPTKSPSIFYPRTLTDFRKLDEWIASGLENWEIANEMTDPIWRTELIVERSIPFCSNCLRRIKLEACLACGQTGDTDE